jgi:hypothetical protein
MSIPFGTKVLLKYLHYRKVNGLGGFTVPDDMPHFKQWIKDQLV